MILRETANYRAEKSAKGVRIIVKRNGHYPKFRVVKDCTFEALKTMNDASFDGSCVLELGIGTFARR
jgi:hypothetical protein